MRRSLLLLISLLGGLAPTLAAQIGTATDIITGTITDSVGRPLADAVVEALSQETQVLRTARTNSRGRFTILFPDGGGQYRMTARAIGMSPASQMLYRLGEEDRLVWNASLSSRAVVLDEITIRAGPRPVVNPDRPTAGANERSLTPDALARLPIDQGDLNLVATLVPGVVALAGTDSSAAAFSVAGLGPEANAVTLDGLLFGTGLVPQDGVRNTRVITNTYDVARGQFSGGLVSVTTRSGSNVVQGSANYGLRDEALSVEAEDSPFGQGYNQHNLSGGVGGPLVRNRFFGFISGQARLRDDQSATLLNATRSDLTRLGAAPDSVDRFLGAVSGLGLNPASDNVDQRANDAYSALLRLDYLLSDAHTLTLRGDWQGTTQDPTRLGLTALPQSSGVMESSGSGGAATLTSRFGAQVINEARAYYSGSRRDATGFQRLPSGRVQVASALEDGTTGITTLVFGGSASLPTRSRTSGLELANEVSWLPGDGSHRIKIGGLWSRRDASDLLAQNQFGTFTFNSLEDLEAGQPSLFTRTLAPLRRESSTSEYAVYAGDTWRITRELQLTYGLRWDGTALGDAPGYNPAADSLFGLRTDVFPSDQHLSPRVGFNYIVGESNQGIPSLVLRGGVGEFRSQVAPGLAATAAASTGLPGTEGQVYCVGTAVPTPDWALYRQDPASIPMACLGPGTGNPLPGQARNITAFESGFAAPRAWRASLGVLRSLSPLIRLSFDASYARGIEQTRYRERNLAAQPAFVLGEENGRPVYAPAGTIVPATGAVPLLASRVDSSFGHVLGVGSGLQSESVQLGVGFNGITSSGIIFNASYTWSDAREQVTGVGAGGGNTAGDPNQAFWSSSNFQRRHSLLLTTMIPIGRSLELTTISRLTSGAPYTPLVGNDINGDGYRNDRAFVFDAGSDSALDAGIESLLDHAPGRVRDCLERQRGLVAARNSCTGPWQASVDLQLNWRPAFWGLNRRVTVQLVTANLLGGLDQLFHGQDDLHGWGQNARPDPTLLYVTGFDPQAQTFSYSVNERFGAAGGQTTAIRSPFQLGFQVRVAIGPDRTRQALDNLRGRGGAAGGRGFDPAVILERIRQAWPNPARVTLGMKDSLDLTPEQEQALTALADSVDLQQEALVNALRNELEKAGPSPDPQRLFAALQPRFQEGMAATRNAIARIRAVLNEEQWNRLPESIRNPRRFGGPGGQGGPGRDGP